MRGVGPRNWILGGAAALVLTCLAFAPARAADPAPAAASDEPTQLKSVLRQPVPNLPGNTMTVVEVDLPPGAGLPAHEHGGFAFAYVLAGEVRSQVSDPNPAVYKAGECWTEAPGAEHKVFENASKSAHARVLVVFVAADDARLTSFH